MQDTSIELGIPQKGTSWVVHYIDTGNIRPIKMAPWIIMPFRHKINDEVVKMLEAGVIRQSKSNSSCAEKIWFT